MLKYEINYTEKNCSNLFHLLKYPKRFLSMSNITIELKRQVSTPDVTVQHNVAPISHIKRQCETLDVNTTR